MEFMQEEVKGYSDREEDQEEEEDIIREESNSKQQQYPFLSPSLSSSSATYKSQQNQWLGMLHNHHRSPEATTTTESHNSSSGLGLQLHQKDAAAINFTNRKLEDLMELSLGNKDDEANFHVGGCSSGGGGGQGTSSSGNNGSNNDPIQKEHMFDKVVTPSDVGKLNRLVIPKQHAEKYFPLDSSGNEKGLLLNFEDRNGKLWRFRYSYWNSSQSYVMTKGWSRFVKEKKLDAGDIVSFQRGVGESFRHKLYIDWRRRPDHGIHDPGLALLTPFLLQNQPHLSQYSIRWGGRLYSVPSPAASMEARHHEHLQQMNYNNMYPFYPQNHHHLQHQRLQHQQQYQQYHNYNYNELNSVSGSLYNSRSAAPPSMADHQNFQGQLQEGRNSPMIIDSVPVIAHKHGKSSTNTTKRLRLFGVNMECASSAEEQKNSVANVTMAANALPSSSSVPPLHLRAAHEDHSISSSFNNQAGFSEKARTSMFFDLDPSLQYRQ